MKRFKKDENHEQTLREIYQQFEKDYYNLYELTEEQLREIEKHNIFKTAETQECLLSYEIEKIEDNIKKMIYKNIKNKNKQKQTIKLLNENLDEILITYIMNKHEYNKDTYKKYLIAKYQTKLIELEKINKELYNLTELFEGKNPLDFEYKLWNIFKNKIGQYTKTANKISICYFN